MNLKEVIQQMAEDDCNSFLATISSDKGDKLITLFRLIREGYDKEDELENKMNITYGAKNNLKWRLSERLQKFLGRKTPPSVSREQVSRLDAIPSIVYNFPKDTAIAHLLAMEKEFSRQDNPIYMSRIYQALKILNIHSPRFYEFDKKYNKHFAYAGAIDKAEVVLANFLKVLGEYLLSRDKDKLELLGAYKVQMAGIGSLYESHHLKVYENLLNAHCDIFLPPYPNTAERTADELLEETEKIITGNPDEPMYKFLPVPVNFLWMEFYRKHGLRKKSDLYYEKIGDNFICFMNYNIIVFTCGILDARIERHLLDKEDKRIGDDFDQLAAGYSPEPGDTAGNIYLQKLKAAGAYYNGKYTEALKILTDLINERSLHMYFHADIELRLFFVVCALLAGKYEIASDTLKSVQRKLREREGDEYENAEVLIKLLSVPMSADSSGWKEKMLSLRDKFVRLNTGHSKILSFLRVDDGLVRLLSRRPK